MSWTLHNGDCLTELQKMPDKSVHCCVTSPPYFGLRDYGVDGQIGLEQTPDEYVAKLVDIFREVKRVLRDDGTLWLNLGDSYAGSGKGIGSDHGKAVFNDNHISKTDWKTTGLKSKDLIGIPWRVAFALQADGWWLRSDIIWAKGNPMPESVTDKPTKAHEYIFLLSKSERYYYDVDSIREPFTEEKGGRVIGRGIHGSSKARGNDLSNIGGFPQTKNGRNKRTVWNINTKPFSEAHFAVFPPEIPETCIKAGCPEDGTVLDPFAGAGTTLWVAEQLGVNSIGIELNPKYCEIIERRMTSIGMSLFG